MVSSRLYRLHVNTYGTAFRCSDVNYHGLICLISHKGSCWIPRIAKFELSAVVLFVLFDKIAQLYRSVSLPIVKMFIIHSLVVWHILKSKKIQATKKKLANMIGKHISTCWLRKITLLQRAREGEKAQRGPKTNKTKEQWNNCIQIPLDSVELNSIINW